MIPLSFDYARAASLDDALAALAAGDGSKVIAGGHSLVPVLKFRMAQPTRLVDIAHLPELKGITAQGGEVRIGATTTYRELLESPLVAPYRVLTEAVSVIGDIQIRNRGTIGGALAHADPAADLPAVMVVLDARFELRSRGGTRTVPARGFFHGPFETAKADEELLTAVVLPALPAGAGSTYLKFESKASGYAIAAVAAVVARSGGTVSRADVAFTGVGDHATLLAAGASLVGTAGDAAAIAAAAERAVEGIEITGDVHAPAEYRTHLAQVAFRRAVATAVSRSA